jgi:hypothetical protein
MFNWNRERAPVAKVASIPTLSLEETKQVSGAGFLLVERRPAGFLLVEQSRPQPASFLLVE